MKKRIYNLDYARTFAIICVVLTHAIEAVFYSNWIGLPRIYKSIAIILFTIGRLGVPIFLMLSGALLLNKKFETKKDIINFYKRNLIPLIVTVEIWNVLYYIFLVFFENVKFCFSDLLKFLLFIKQIDLPNMWYMPMIIGIYIAIPFISIILKRFSFKELLIPVCIILFYRFLLPTLNPILISLNLERLGSVIDLNFLGSSYGLYIILGYYIYNFKLLRKMSFRKILGIIVLNFVLAILFQIFCSIGYFKYNVGTRNYRIWYDSIFILLCSVPIFELFLRAKTISWLNHICSDISKSALAIYFIHIIIQFLILNQLTMFFDNLLVVFILLFIFNFLITYLLVYLFRDNKLIRKYLFLYKL